MGFLTTGWLFDFSMAKVGTFLMKILRVMISIFPITRMAMAQKSPRLGNKVKVSGNQALDSNKNHSMLLVDKRGKHHIKMTAQRRTLTMIMMRVLEAWPEEAQLSDKTMEGQPIT